MEIKTPPPSFPAMDGKSGVIYLSHSAWPALKGIQGATLPTSRVCSDTGGEGSTPNSYFVLEKPTVSFQQKVPLPPMLVDFGESSGLLWALKRRDPEGSSSVSLFWPNPGDDLCQLSLKLWGLFLFKKSIKLKPASPSKASACVGAR